MRSPEYSTIGEDAEELAEDLTYDAGKIRDTARSLRELRNRRAEASGSFRSEVPDGGRFRAESRRSETYGQNVAGEGMDQAGAAAGKNAGEAAAEKSSEMAGKGAAEGSAAEAAAGGAAVEAGASAAAAEGGEAAAAAAGSGCLLPVLIVCGILALLVIAGAVVHVLGNQAVEKQYDEGYDYEWKYGTEGNQ